MKRSHLKALWFVLLSSAISLGCGGGGGGNGTNESGDFSGAANASIRTTPSKIDSGDRTRVSIDLSDVHENGIAVKIRYPVGLAYVTSSAFLNFSEKEIDVSPTVNEMDKREGVVYLVFYLSQAQFKRPGQEYSGEQGTLTLQLEGREALRDGEIEVDPDVDDPLEDNATEFNIENPEFVAEDSTSIEVVAE